MILILSLACFGACQEEALPEGELKCPVEAVEGP